MEIQKVEIPDELLEEASGGANHSPTDTERSSSGQMSSSLKKESNLPSDLPESGNTMDSPIDIRQNILTGKPFESPWNMSTIEADMNRIGLPNI